jgi:hypothetical protein
LLSGFFFFGYHLAKVVKSGYIIESNAKRRKFHCFTIKAPVQINGRASKGILQSGPPSFDAVAAVVFRLGLIHPFIRDPAQLGEIFRWEFPGGGVAAGNGKLLDLFA